MYSEIINLKKKADELTSSLLDLKKQELSEIAEVLADTAAVTKEYAEGEFIPKELCKLLMSIDDYLYFATFIEDGQLLDFYCYQAVSNIVTSIKDRLFEGRSEYVFGSGEPAVYTLSPTKEAILSYLESVENRTAPDHNGISIPF